MKRILPLLLLATLLLLVALPQAALARSNDHHPVRIHGAFSIPLSGDQQSPPVTTDAFGSAHVRLIHNGTALEFRVLVCNIVDVILSHIHAGGPGTNGPVVVHFFDQPTSPVSTGSGCRILAHGIRTASDLVAHPEAGVNNWTDFVHALLAGNTYVNVHTVAHPGGELRGQLVLHSQDRQGND